MNTDQHDASASKVSLTDALLDLGLEWAALGVSFGSAHAGIGLARRQPC